MTLNEKTLTLLVCIVTAVSTRPLFYGDKFPKNQYEYFMTRDSILQLEREYEHRNWKLTEDEKIADHYLGFLKWLERNSTLATGFPPSKPIQDTIDIIQSGHLYQTLRELPKGGILHSHEDHQLSKTLLFDIVWKSKDFEYLYIIPPSAEEDAWTMDFFVNPPLNKPWVKVKESGLTKEEIIKKNTLIGLLTTNATNNPTDASLRWKLINPLWRRSSIQLIANIDIKKSYLTAMYEHCMSEGVSYLETRRGLGNEMTLYELDHSGRSNRTNGKRFLDPTYELDVTFTVDMTQRFMAHHSRFIGHKKIAHAIRSMSKQDFLMAADVSVRLHRKFPQHVIGFDLVGEEDAGHSNLYFIDEFLSLYSDGKPAIPLYLHSLETSWPDDLLTSQFEDDLVPTSHNGYEAVILTAKRVGHGKGFLKKPFLRKILREREIAVEVCIISNQILGMDVDMRNHYGQVLHKEGIPIVLSPDDPGTFGTDNATLDWYAAFSSWGLNLGDLKKIALNSLIYSGMTNEEKEDAIKNKWLPSWNEYIAKLKTTACSRDFAKEAAIDGRNVTFNRLMPDSGKYGTLAHIFGRNFEAAICKIPKCKFGKSPVTDAVYGSYQQLTCVVPQCEDCPVGSRLPLQVALDGKHFLETGLVFVYNGGFELK